MEKVYFWGGMAVGRVRFAANVDSKQHVDGKTQVAFEFIDGDNMREWTRTST